MADPNWKRGFYYDDLPPHTGMKLARRTFLTIVSLLFEAKTDPSFRIFCFSRNRNNHVPFRTGMGTEIRSTEERSRQYTLDLGRRFSFSSTISSRSLSRFPHRNLPRSPGRTILPQIRCQLSHLCLESHGSLRHESRRPRRPRST